MLIHCGLLLLFLNFARTIEDNSDYGLAGNHMSEYNRFSFWPSVHNAAKLLRIRREQEIQPTVVAGQSEGGVQDVKMSPVTAAPASSQPSTTHAVNKAENNGTNDTVKSDLKQPAVTGITNETAPVTAVVNNTETKNHTQNQTVTDKKNEKELDLNGPGVVKRGIIVFGGFALLAIAYLIFYRRKSKNSDMNNAHNTNDANQFRYGVLQSEDRRDNLELSRVPLTMESDDEDDEDMEIFDLEQKKKSMSYVNLQGTDEDIVLNSENRENNTDNLLLDIEDGSTDILINWSSNGSKSIS